MCGIVGYVGPREAAPILMDGLKRMEYRGYDSAGIAVINGDGLTVRKAAGKLSVLADELAGNAPHGRIGIGHTRWATHGAPTTPNAHPHTDRSGRIALIHNGIIENAADLRKALVDRGHEFTSETDTEVLAHLIGVFYEGNLEEAVASALRDVDGAYGICVISSDEPDVLVTARNGSPIILGIGDDEYLVASDQSALVEHTRSVVYLDNGEMAILTPKGYRVRTLRSRRVDKPVNQIEWDLETIERGGFDHFMLKEIFEQPESIENTMRGHLLPETGDVRVYGLKLDDHAIKAVKRIIITACGTSWHSALIGKYMLEELARVPTEVEYASEFRYRNPIVDEDTVVIAISQSGETADTLAALQEAKRRGARSIGLVNVVGSTIAREVDGGLYLRCGPEVGVASTKAFTSQVVALAMVTLRFARLKQMSLLDGKRYVEALAALPGQVAQILERAEEVQALADEFADATNALYLGRGVNFPTALEGALKLKEISYVHAEGYPAAEMKHGPIALIDENMPVIVVAPRDAIYGKIVSNVQEVRARGGRIIAIVNPGDEEISALAEATFTVPETLDLLSPVLTVIPLQLFSYYVAVRRGCNVDQPRNLAKSVTVE
ncbi:MAG: glutamine--fructose-6-phosphate transaminase (isomerizing) [Gemmatimonadetes bacterium]|nr:glutamine--fructose-6-phosphate transaminase (isomerizing) [Gemmatimonadota bacterium]HRX17965.1 glutamine--fructose-6-phosphate transaminase (isomerizing) [Gemmatimonadales bacterium]